MKTIPIIITIVLLCAALAADETDFVRKPWNVLGVFDGENAELEIISEVNINQLEDVDSLHAKIVVVFDRIYKQTRDSSVRIYDIEPDTDRRRITSNSISIGERDLGQADVLDEFLSKYLGQKNILIFKSHGYGIISPGSLRYGYNNPQDPLIISAVLRQRLNAPLEAVIFDSCNMATVEVAYELKDLVSVVVASQDLMYYSVEIMDGNTHALRPGIDYVDLISSLKPNHSAITIGKNVVTAFMDIVNKEDALFYKATISAMDLETLDVRVFKTISDALMQGLTNPNTRSRFLTALRDTLDSASQFQPLGRNRILTHYDIEDFLRKLEDNLDMQFDRPNAAVIQSYSNGFVKQASGLSILFFKDLSNVSSVRKKTLFETYARSKFAKATGWDKLMLTYHQYLAAHSLIDAL